MNKIRLGLCCIFREAQIKFRSTTAKALSRLSRPEQLTKLSRLCLDNAESLLAAVQYVTSLSIGAFRILSPLFPRMTHPDVGYALSDLAHEGAIRKTLGKVKRWSKQHDLRLSFHPDQFVVLASPRREVIDSARGELDYQARLAALVGADEINLHIGGAYGDKQRALERFAKNFRSLRRGIRQRLTVENDDRTYTVSDLLPLCHAENIPLVFDVHHHRCNPDGSSVAEATAAAIETWQRLGREPHFHVSSPRNGWDGSDRRPHADYVDIADFPDEWRHLELTVDVEGKAKELAVLRLQQDLAKSLRG